MKKKKEITLEYIDEKLDKLAREIAEMRTDIRSVRFDGHDFRKEIERLDKRLTDTQDDVQKILEIAKGGDNRLGFWQIATAH